MKKSIRMNIGITQELPEDISDYIEVGRYILDSDVDRFMDGSRLGFRYVTIANVWEEKDIPNQIVITKKQMETLLRYIARERKITAIKTFREIANSNFSACPTLKQAKEYIESLLEDSNER